MKALLRRIDKLEKATRSTDVAVIIYGNGQTMDEALARWIRVHPDRDLDRADLQIRVNLVEAVNQKENASERRPSGG